MTATEKKLMLAFRTIFGEFELDFTRKIACFIRGGSLFRLISSCVYRKHLKLGRCKLHELQKIFTGVRVKPLKILLAVISDIS